MGNKNLIAVVFVLAFASIFSVIAFANPGPPQWSNNVSSTPTEYNPNILSLFNTTWSDDLDVDAFHTALFETNLTGSPQNFTAFRWPGTNISSFNATYPVGTFYGRFYANDSGGEFNVTSNFTFTITSNSTNPVNLELNGTLNNNRTYIYPEAVNATGYATYTSSGTVSLYRNGTAVSNPELIQLGNATYAYKVNITGNQNYTSNFSGATFYAFVNKGTLSLSLSGSNVTYPTAVNIIPSESNIGDKDVNYTFYRNDTGRIGTSNETAPPADTTQLAAGWYNYTLNTTNDIFGNWTANVTGIYSLVNVIQGTALSWTFNPTGDTIDTNTVLNVNCTSSSSQIIEAHGNAEPPTSNFTLKKGSGAIYTSWANMWIYWSGTLPAGDHLFNCTTPGNQNYSSIVNLTKTIHVTQAGGGQTGGGTGTGTGPQLGAAEFKLQNLSDVSAGAGESITTTFNVVTANQPRTIKDIVISLTGIDASWYSASPNNFQMDVDETKTITITFSIPGDAEQKLYPITVTAAGSEVVTNTSKTATGAMVLTVGTPVAGTTAGPTGAPFTLPTLTLPTNVTGILLIFGLVGGVVLYIFKGQIYGRLREMRRPIFRGFKPSPQPQKS